MSGRPRVVVDLLGAGIEADSALAAVTAFAGEAAFAGGVEVSVVADPATSVPDGVTLVPAQDAVVAGEDALRAVRSRRGASVRLATRLVRDGAADAVVSLGPVAATLAAAQFSLGRIAGMTKVCLAAELVRGPAASEEQTSAVLVDAGASPEAGPESLVQHAYAGVAYARARLGIADPVVGLLSAGFRPGSGDPVHDETDRRLRGLPFRYAGPVQVTDVLDGAGPVDVVVTDGFTGVVLTQALARVGRSHAREAVLLGVDGVVVAAPPERAGEAVAVAAGCVRDGVTAALAGEMGLLVARRRGA